VAVPQAMAPTTHSAPCLTVFALPKAFRGHAGVIQENAVRSWAAHGLAVILMGRDEGIAEMAAAVGGAHLPDVACNELGTPRLDSAFGLAAERASTRLIMYANSDILFPEDPGRVAAGLGMEEFLAVGRRTNVDVTARMDYADAAWLAGAARLARENGELFHQSAIDYFILPRASRLTRLPPFVVGRPGWDNWMLANTLELGLPLMDLTGAVLAVHQNHDYGHIKRDSARQRGWEGPETDTNRKIAGGKYRDINDCTHRVGADGRVTVDHWNKARMHLRRARAGAGICDWVWGLASVLHPRAWGPLARRAVK
jgi:hypothetical protein